MTVPPHTQTPFTTQFGWPTPGDVAGQLGVTSAQLPESVGVATAAAADMVMADVGWEPSVDGIPSQLWSAALLAAVQAVKAPDAPHGIAAVFDTGALYVARDHPTYIRLLRGFHVSGSFGVA